MINIGNTTISKLFIGSTEIDKIYIGSVLIWQNKIKLDTPTNVSISGNTISFEEISNATSYAVYAGDILLGEYTVSSHEAEQEGNMLTIYNVGEDNIDFENGVMTLT